MQTVIPLGLRDRRQPSTGVPDYSYKGSKTLNTTILFDPMSGVNGSQPLTCSALAPDMPTGGHCSCTDLTLWSVLKPGQQVLQASLAPKDPF